MGLVDIDAEFLTCAAEVTSQEEDILGWTPPNGDCTTKEAYRFLARDQNQPQLPHQESRSITREAMNILERTWKHKTLPPA